MTNYLRLKKILYIVSLAAVSIVVALIEIPNFIITGPLSMFVKLDFSDVAILVAMLVLGTKETIFVIIIRTFARRIFRSFELGDVMGELIAAVASLAIMLGYSFALKLLGKKEKPLIVEVPVNNQKTTIKEFVVVSTSIALFLTVFMVLFNYFIGTPFYLSYFAFVGSEGASPLHLTVFSFIKAGSTFAGVPLTYNNFFWMAVISYSPFNILKGILIAVTFLIIKPKLKYLEL